MGQEVKAAGASGDGEKLSEMRYEDVAALGLDASVAGDYPH